MQLMSLLRNQASAVHGSGDEADWEAMDKLHQAIVVRLVHTAESEMQFCPEFQQLITDSIGALLEASRAASPGLRRFYLDRGMQHCAPPGAGLLYAVAAAAHCSGSCSDSDAAAIAAAALPYASQVQSSTSALWSYLAPALRKMCGSKGSSASNRSAGICACRQQLLRVMHGTFDQVWHPALLATEVSGPDASAIVGPHTELAPTDGGSSRHRQVLVARLDLGGQMGPGEPQRLRLNVERRKPGWIGVFTCVDGGTDAQPVRVRVNVGMLRKSSAALAAFTVAADVWVHDSEASAFAQRDGMWSCGAPPRSRARSLIRSYHSGGTQCA
jgi:hypothetical protein